MNQYETGKHTPGFEMLDKIANALSMPTAYFYTDDDQLAQLITTYGKLNMNAKRNTVKYIKKLTDG